MKQIDHLLDVHHKYNRDYFGGMLSDIKILIKRNRHKDGYYQYRAHKNDAPIRDELKRAVIVISEDHYKPTPDWGGIYGTLLHEMIHQYQAEILNEDPDHNDTFTHMATQLEKTTGYTIK